MISVWLRTSANAVASWFGESGGGSWEWLPDGPLIYLGVGVSAFVAALLLWPRLVGDKPRSVVHMVGVSVIISAVVFLAMCIGIAISVRSFNVIVAFVFMPFTVGWKLTLLEMLWGLIWGLNRSPTWISKPNGEAWD